MDELVAWLRGVLEEQKRVATLPRVGSEGFTAGHDLARTHAEATRRTLARIEAELALVDAYVAGDLNQCVMADVLTVLARGHRFDRPGWREEWAPAGFELPFEQAGKGNVGAGQAP